MPQLKKAGNKNIYHEKTKEGKQEKREKLDEFQRIQTDDSIILPFKYLTISTRRKTWKLKYWAPDAQSASRPNRM